MSALTRWYFTPSGPIDVSVGINMPCANAGAAMSADTTSSPKRFMGSFNVWGRLGIYPRSRIQRFVATAPAKKAAQEERKFPLWPLVAAVVAVVANKFVRAGSDTSEFAFWLYWLAIGLVGVATLFHIAPRKNGKVVETPFNLDFLGPLGVAGLVYLAASAFVYDNGQNRGDRSASVVQMSIALAAFAVITWGYWLALRNRGRDFQLLRDRLLVVLGISAGAGYVNFGHLHFDAYIHTC